MKYLIEFDGKHYHTNWLSVMDKYDGLIININDDFVNDEIKYRGFYFNKHWLIPQLKVKTFLTNKIKRDEKQVK